MKNSFTSLLTNCECCPRRCRVNRFTSRGFCRLPADAVISHAGLHFGEEPPISGQRGSGTIFFTGCNLRCLFCQNHQISQEFRSGDYETLTVDELANKMLWLQKQGAHNVNFVSPSHQIYQMADAILLAKEKGLAIPIVYNSNGYDAVAALQYIRGLVDVYLPDLKYMENAPARLLSAADDYADVAPDVLREMLNQVGQLTLDENGIAARGLLVRHLVLPGYLSNSKKCLDFLAELSPDIFISLMSQYSPQYKACRFSGINRPLHVAEYEEIVDYAVQLGLENVFVQEMSSQENYLPDFAREDPFESA